MKSILILSLLLLPTLVFAQETKEFVSLTKIPGLTDIAASPNVEIFLNNLYRICIGLAAVIAVLQIIRAGVMYMLGDSFTEKKEAKNLIAMSIFGLVLVLSPVIVFSIINKDILSLKFDVSSLKPVISSPSTGSETPVPAGCEFKQVKGPVSSSDFCSVHGTGWEDAPALCCSATDGKKCCGNKSAPTTGSTKTITATLYVPPGYTGKEGEADLGAAPADKTEYGFFLLECLTKKGKLETKSLEEPKQCSTENKKELPMASALCVKVQTTCSGLPE